MTGLALKRAVCTGLVKNRKVLKVWLGREPRSMEEEGTKKVEA
jgi:hypothetical protein